MENFPLFSIGHGSRKAGDFLALLEQYNIRILADVRSKPYSRFHPQFNKNKLDTFLASFGISYVFMGDELGGRPEDPSCYNAEGKIDYNVVKEKDFFKAGIERLIETSGKGLSLAMMCSERDPAMCHRCNLIGKVLLEHGIDVHHIDEKGEIRNQSGIGRSGPDLFNQKL